MAPDWRQLLRWLNPGRPAGDLVEKAAPDVYTSDATTIPPGEGSTKTERPVAPRSAVPASPSPRKSSDAPTQGPRQMPPDTAVSPPLNRNGIPVIHSGDDVERLLLDTEESDPEDDSTAADVSPPVVRVRDVERDVSRPSRAVRRGKPHTNRHGLPLLSDQDDLQEHFRETVSNSPPSDDRDAASPRRPDHYDCRDKNGIPVLDHCHDLGRLLGAASDERDSDEDLREAFERSIAHDARTLIKKKTDGYFPTRHLTLKERLKRYPHPQAQLDLHGLTAIQADQQTDAYIRTAHADGLFTLRIIVGKGLHSASGAVLPDVVEDRLNRLKRDGLVMTYRWDKGVKRKSGAVIVYLEAPF